MRKIFLLLPVLCALASCQGVKDTDYSRVEIDKGWQFSRVGSDEWYPATVPGVVHTDLLANKLIEDPYYSTNESKLQWIENEQWDYKTTFVPTDAQLSANQLVIDFKGLDTYAEVYLNDSLILEADNMFVEWRVPVKGIVKEGANELRVRFLSAYKEGIEFAKKYPKLPADNDKGVDYKTSVFTRKAQYHYGWDWGPRFVTAGIWKPVYLESYNDAVVDNIHYIQKSQSPEKADFVAVVTINSLNDCSGTMTITDEKGGVYGTINVSLKKGENKAEVPFVINNPEYWWPNGMGKGLPKLYPVTATLDVNGHKAWEESTKIGVRTVKLVRERDSIGESFLFEVNGEPLFMKGANLIPQDVFLPEVTAERYRRMVEIARESNMNMLRVWGGGIYESDDFYNACDSLGILVWQDFPFACAFYPWDEPFYNSVRLEARQNIRRLRNHPSLAIWCGNNEIDEAWHKWGYKEDKVNYPWTEQEQADIRKGIDDLFFDKVIPGVLAQEDTTRSYHPSSPLFGWGDPRSQTWGDVHYWGVFHGEEPFSVYKEKPGRFSNEYGHQSPANYQTWRKWLTDEDLNYTYSFYYEPLTDSSLYKEPKDDAFAVHQKNPKGYRVIRQYMEREVPVITDDVATYVYLAQLVQADGIRIAMEGHRQNRPFTMGSIYWQINDCWPVTSWSSMDYPFGYKALQYFAKESFAPTIFSFDKEEASGRVELWGLNDRLESRKGEYRLTLMTLDGDTLSTSEHKCEIPANASIKLFDEAIDTVLNGADPKKVVLVCDGVIEDEPCRKLFFFLPYKDIDWPEADIEIVSIEKGNDRQTVTLKAGNVVKAVLLETKQEQTDNASDAYFDMLPGEVKSVDLHFVNNNSTVDYKTTNLNDIIAKYKKTHTPDSLGMTK